MIQRYGLFVWISFILCRSKVTCLVYSYHNPPQPSPHVNQDQYKSIIKNKLRISSVESSHIIQSAYNNQTTTKSPLLIITSDASLGSSRTVGLASILRLIHGSHNKDENQHQLQQQQQIRGNDDILLATRRSSLSQDIVTSELAAILLGLKVACTHLVSSSLRRQIIILSDCERALSLLESSLHAYSTTNTTTPNNSYNYNKKKTKSTRKKKNHDSSTSYSSSYSSTLLQQWIQLVTQIQVEQQQEEEEDKENHKNHNTFIHIAKVKSAHTNENGFFDHEMADILSSYIKTQSNSYWKQYTTRHATFTPLQLGTMPWIQLGDNDDRNDPSSSIIDYESLNHNQQQQQQCMIPKKWKQMSSILTPTTAPSLQCKDLLYLSNSESVSSSLLIPTHRTLQSSSLDDSIQSTTNSNPWDLKTLVQQKKESGARKQRCYHRIMTELQLDFLSL